MKISQPILNNLERSGYWVQGIIIKVSEVCSEIKETTFSVGHFTIISGHFMANYINIFHKTDVLIPK